MEANAARKAEAKRKRQEEDLVQEKRLADERAQLQKAFEDEEKSAAQKKQEEARSALEQQMQAKRKEKEAAKAREAALERKEDERIKRQQEEMRVQYLKETGDPTAAAAAKSLKMHNQERASQSVVDAKNQQVADAAKEARQRRKSSAHEQSIKDAHGAAGAAGNAAAKARVFGAGPGPGTPKGPRAARAAPRRDPGQMTMLRKEMKEKQGAMEKALAEQKGMLQQLRKDAKDAQSERGKAQDEMRRMREALEKREADHAARLESQREVHAAQLKAAQDVQLEMATGLATRLGGGGVTQYVGGFPDYDDGPPLRRGAGGGAVGSIIRTGDDVFGGGGGRAGGGGLAPGPSVSPLKSALKSPEKRRGPGLNVSFGNSARLGKSLVSDSKFIFPDGRTAAPPPAAARHAHDAHQQLDDGELPRVPELGALPPRSPRNVSVSPIHNDTLDMSVRSAGTVATHATGMTLGGDDIETVAARNASKLAKLQQLGTSDPSTDQLDAFLMDFLQERQGVDAAAIAGSDRALTSAVRGGAGGAVAAAARHQAGVHGHGGDTDRSLGEISLGGDTRWVHRAS